MAAKRTTDTYDASSIEQLEGLEAVRKRPGMYIGGTGNDGLHHLVWELIDNGVDEAAAGHASAIEVTLHRDGSVEVTDNGRGIPTGKRDGERTALEVVFTELHAGGKFGGGAYGASGGLHGVGASVVNALSSRLVAEVDRDGVTQRLTFVDRRPVRAGANGRLRENHQLEKVKKVAPRTTGTRVRFWPDTELFDPDAFIEFARIRDHVAQVCFLVPGLKIRLTDKRAGTKHAPEEFVAKGGLADYVDHLSIGETTSEIITIRGVGTFTEKVPVHGKMTEVERECAVDIAMRWVKGYDTTLLSFVNTIATGEGGTHIAGFERALTRAVNDVLLKDAKKLAKLVKEDRHRAEKADVQEGLVATVKVVFPEPQFKGQTKGELGTPGVQSIVYEVAKDGLADWITGSGKKTHVAAVRDKITNAILNRVANRQALENRRKAQSMGSTGMPDKLADCRYHGPDSEILIVEGDSAAGPAKQGRDSETMAVLPIRGKMVNAGKATTRQVLDNAEAQAIFTAVGAGSGRDFNLADARYGRVIILCDADVDGSHIRCLLLTLMFQYMRPLLEAGRVYAAQPPLFSTKVGGTVHYAYSDAERDRLEKELHDDRPDRRIPWVRFKGLGEMDVDELAETTLNRSTRVLKRMTMDDAKEAARAAEMFDTLMGTDVARRKDFLLKNSELVDPTMLDI